MSTKDDRRDLVAEMYPLKTQAEIAKELEVHRNTVSSDVNAIRKENQLILKTDAKIDWNAQMREVLHQIEEFKEVASRLKDGARVRLGLAIMDRWLKLIDMNSPRMLLVGTGNLEDMSSDKILWNLFDKLNLQNKTKAIQLMENLWAEQDGTVPIEIVESTGDRIKRITGLPGEYTHLFVGVPPAKRLVEGVVISPAGEPMRPGHGKG